MQNVGALTVVQAVGYLIPLLTLPYLTRVLGPEEWGRVAWMQVMLGYFSVFTDWGFSWSGTRKAATLRNDIEALSESFFAGWTVQWLLCIISVSVLLCFGFFVPFFSPFRPYVFFGSAVIIAGVLFPVWLLSGLERMREIAVIQLLIRTCALPLIFLLVRGSGDGKYVIFAAGLTGIMGGISSLYWMRKHLLLRWQCPRWADIQKEFLESGAIFFSRVWIVLYTTLSPTILGVMTGAESVGQFVLADRIRMAVQSLLAPVSQALFPRMSYLFAHNRAAAIALLRRSGLIIVFISAAASLALYVLAKPIVLFVAGGGFQDAVNLLRWLSPLPFVIALSNIFGVQIMLPNLMTRAFNRILAGAGFMSLGMIWLWIAGFGAEGAAINTLIVECFVTGSMALFLFTKRKVLHAN